VRGGRPAPGPGARLGRRGAVALLGGLLARAEQLADLRPREAGATSVGDEALQQRVAGLAELAAELNRRTQSISGRLGRARAGGGPADRYPTTPVDTDPPIGALFSS
jgi:hypothetical protein